jgi:hypothetical protein
MKKILFLTSLAVLMVGTDSCKKKEAELRSTKIGGCLDPNSLNYNASSDFDDESCQYAYVNQYEITYHPSKDCGSDWDLLVNTDADLILKIKVKTETTWFFESPELSNQAHNVPAVWTAPVNIKLLNTIYSWELIDYDSTSGNDVVATGEFNPMDVAADGKVIVIGKNSCNEETQLVLYYTVQ